MFISFQFNIHEGEHADAFTQVEPWNSLSTLLNCPSSAADIGTVLNKHPSHTSLLPPLPCHPPRNRMKFIPRVTCRKQDLWALELPRKGAFFPAGKDLHSRRCV